MNLTHLFLRSLSPSRILLFLSSSSLTLRVSSLSSPLFFVVLSRLRIMLGAVCIPYCVCACARVSVVGVCSCACFRIYVRVSFASDFNGRLIFVLCLFFPPFPFITLLLLRASSSLFLLALFLLFCLCLCLLMSVCTYVLLLLFSLICLP